MNHNCVSEINLIELPLDKVSASNLSCVMPDREV